MTQKDEDELLPSSTTSETAIDISATIAGFAPWIGGPLSSLLSGVSQARKMKRIKEVLVELKGRIGDFQSEVSKEYVKTEDFQDLAEKALLSAASERSEEKRKLFAEFLTNDIKSPDKPYDEKQRFLKLLEDMQISHVFVLRAMAENPSPVTIASEKSRSLSQELLLRFPEHSQETANHIYKDLVEWRLVSPIDINAPLVAGTVYKIADRITPLGYRFLMYIA